MASYCPLPQIITGTTVGTVGTPLRLKRIVSKLYVDASGAHASDGFILTGVSVINVPVQGALAFEYGNANETLPITAQFTDYGHKSGSASRLDNPIIASSTGFAGHMKRQVARLTVRMLFLPVSLITDRFVIIARV